MTERVDRGAGFFTRHGHLRRAVALVLAAVLPSACVTWRPAFGPQSYVAAERQSHVRAGLIGGEVVDLYSPTLLRGDLVGYRHEGADTSRVAIPTSQVKYIDVRRTDVAGSVLVVVTLSVAAFVAIGLATFQGFRGGGSLFQF